MRTILCSGEQKGVKPKGVHYRVGAGTVALDVAGIKILVEEVGAEGCIRCRGRAAEGSNRRWIGSDCCP